MTEPHPIPTGWLCPECRVVHAPETRECRCVVERKVRTPLDDIEKLLEYEREMRMKELEPFQFGDAPHWANNFTS